MWLCPRGGFKPKTAPSAVTIQQKEPFFSLPYRKVSLYLRAYTWLSLRESWRDARKGGETERGANAAPAPSPCFSPIAVL